MDEQNKQTQTYRSLSVASKKDSGEDFNKETEAPSKSLGWLTGAAREGAQGPALEGSREGGFLLPLVILGIAQTLYPEWVWSGRGAKSRPVASPELLRLSGCVSSRVPPGYSHLHNFLPLPGSA